MRPLIYSALRKGTELCLTAGTVLIVRKTLSFIAKTQLPDKRTVPLSDRFFAAKRINQRLLNYKLLIEILQGVVEKHKLGVFSVPKGRAAAGAFTR